MLCNIFMKSLVALLIEMRMATRQYEAEETVLQSIAETMDKNNFMETARINFR